MRNLKRALSLGMTAAMISGLVVTTGAVSYPDVSSSDNLEAIEVLQMAGVMAGDENGKFNPQQNVTRAEMAVVMCNLLGLRVNDYENASIPFTDVPQWAHKYVAACYAEGITGGTSATTYGSNAGVTTAQAALMLMKALGYFQYNGDFGSDWQLATVNQASKIDLFDGIDAGATAALTRSEVAQMALNTLEANMVEVTGSEGVTIGDITVGSTIKYEDITKSDKKYSKIDDTTVEDKYTVQLGEELYDGKLVKEETRDELGRLGNQWTYDNGDPSSVYVEDADYTIVVSKNGEDLAYWADEASSKMKLDTENEDFSVYKNTEEKDEDVELNIGDVIEFRDVNNKKAASITVLSYSVSTIEGVETDVDEDDAEDGVTAYIDVKDQAEFNNTDIAGYNEDTYVEDAVIGYILSKDGKEIIDSYIASSVKGAITASTAATNSKNTSYTMGGTKYTLANDVEAITVDFDGTYELFLDPNGYVVKVDTIEASVSLDDVFYLNEIKPGQIYWIEDETGKKDTTRYYVQAVYMDGTVEDIMVAETSTDKGAVVDYLDSLKGDTFFTDSKHELTKDTDVTLEAWDYAEDDYAVEAVTVEEIDKDTKSLSGAETNYYVNSDTKYVVVESYNDDVKVTVKTGSVSYKYVDGDDVTVIAKKSSGSWVAQYVVIGAADFTAADSGDYIYVVDTDTTVEVADGYQYTAYDKDGKKITIVSDGKIKADGFYGYTVDEDDIYTVDPSTEDNFKTGLTFKSYYGDLLSVDGMKDGNDLDTADAVIIDIHDTDDYSKSVTSLSAMYTAFDKEYTVGLSLVLNADGDVEYIVVTDVVKAE